MAEKTIDRLPIWKRVLNAPFIAGIWLYRLTLSRLTGNSCRFVPSCSQYALEAYHAFGPIRATRLTLWRLARCQPLARGGYDPVPVRVEAPASDAAPDTDSGTASNSSRNATSNAVADGVTVERSRSGSARTGAALDDSGDCG